MSERLRHLQRQQALLREHLAWIESEIAKDAPGGASPDITLPAPPTPPPPVLSRPIPAAVDSEADALIERYAATERQNPRDVRRGCLIIFAAALFTLVGSVVAIWLVYYR